MADPPPPPPATASPDRDLSPSLPTGAWWLQMLPMLSATLPPVLVITMGSQSILDSNRPPPPQPRERLCPPGEPLGQKPPQPCQGEGQSIVLSILTDHPRTWSRIRVILSNRTLRKWPS